MSKIQDLIKQYVYEEISLQDIIDYGKQLERENAELRLIKNLKVNDLFNRFYRAAKIQDMSEEAQLLGKEIVEKLFELENLNIKVSNKHE